MSPHAHWIVALGLVATASASHAEPLDAPVTPDASERGFSGMLVDPPAGGYVALGSSWDGARHGIGARLAGDLPLAARVSLIGGAYAEPSGTWRPYAGARVALTDDLSITGAYRSQGFTEPDGEVELGVLAGHRFGRTLVVANAVYGQDVDAHDRDAELGAAIASAVGPVIASSSSRARFALGAMGDFGAAWDAAWDVGAALPIGRYAARAALGVSAVGTSRVALGPLASLAVSAYF
jgi:hypothetical protein